MLWQIMQKYGYDLCLHAHAKTKEKNIFKCWAEREIEKDKHIPLFVGLIEKPVW